MIKLVYFRCESRQLWDVSRACLLRPFFPLLALLLEFRQVFLFLLFSELFGFLPYLAHRLELSWFRFIAAPCLRLDIVRVARSL